MKFSFLASLRARLVAAFLMLAALIALSLSLPIYIGAEALEHYIFSSGLQTEAGWLTSALKNGARPSLPDGQQLFDDITVPAEYRDLAPGYHEIEVSSEEEWHLYVFEHNDRRYFLLQDGSDYERIEDIINIAIMIMLAVSFSVALWMGRWATARVIAPLARLATAVEHPQQPLPYQDATDEIGVLARAFAAHSQQQQHYLWREQCFTGDASHELRTPLAIIQGAAEIIASRTSNDTPANEAADRIIRITGEMHEQLSAMLLLSRPPEQLQTPQTALEPIIRRTIERCRPLLETKPVRLRFDPSQPVEVPGHPELIASIIHNLLRNACQYTEQGEIVIDLASDGITISDTGPGLPGSVNPALLKRFQQGEHIRGEGLGLSIAQRIADHLGWRLKIDSGPQGSRFRLEFFG